MGVGSAGGLGHGLQQRLGLEVWLLSGDSDAAVARTARELGIRVAKARLRPQDKLDALSKRFDSIEAALSAGPSAEQFVRLSKEYAELEPIVRPIEAYRKL